MKQRHAQDHFFCRSVNTRSLRHVFKAHRSSEEYPSIEDSFGILPIPFFYAKPGFQILIRHTLMRNTSRRNFVKLAGTSLAGATLAPLPIAAAESLPTNPQIPTNVPAGGVGPYASTFRIVPPEGSASDLFLSPQSLSMPGPRISFQGRDLRLYSLRGSTSFRPRTVTGLKAMIYPPLNLSDPQISPPLGLSEGGFFNLSFREEQTGTLIQDIQDEFGDPLYLNQRLKSANRMGPVYTEDESSSILLTQDAQWWPHCYVRTGLFNRRMDARLISFGIECSVFLSNVADEIYEEIDLHNRTDELLTLTVVPDQPRPAGPCPDAKPIDTRSPRFVREEGDLALEVVCDLGPAGAEGWDVSIPPKGSVTFRIALRIRPKTEPATAAFYAPDLRERVRSTIASHLDELGSASSKLPQINTANASFDEFYKRSILSVLSCRRVRENFCVQPFYDLGFSRGAAVAWDTSFSSRLIAQLDPQGLRGMIEAFLRSGGALHSTYLSWTGKSSGWYAQSPFALMRMVDDYMCLTGDLAVLDKQIAGASILDYLKQAGQEFLDHYSRPDGLIDIGGGTGKMLEIRTIGYEHGVATINALAVDYFLHISQWCSARNDPDARTFESASRRTRAALNQLWDEASGWYGNLYPGGTLHQVYSYHLFDMLATSAVPSEKKRRMAERIREGEFLAPYGMYSIALSDRSHWDMEDCDWGGGGQYVGQPLQTVETLFDLGEADRAWQILSRCTQWVERFPYFPQTIFGDNLALAAHQIDWPLQISSGAGAQAIIAGVFGLKPHLDGALTIQPHYNSTLGTATLTGYHFRGRTYSVTLHAAVFSVGIDGRPHATRGYDKPLELPPHIGT